MLDAPQPVKTKRILGSSCAYCLARTAVVCTYCSDGATQKVEEVESEAPDTQPTQTWQTNKREVEKVVVGERLL